MELQFEEFVSRVFAAAEAAGVAPAELALSTAESFSVRVREQKIEDYSVSDTLSVVLRGRYGERIGSAGTQALDEESIAMLVSGVIESARVIETDEQDEILPPDPHYETVVSYEPALEEVTAEQKIARAMEIDRLLTAADPRLKPNMCGVVSQSDRTVMRNTLGLSLEHRYNVIFAFAAAVAKEGEETQSGQKALWGHSLDAVGAEAVADGCAKDALGKLGAGRMKSGSTPVVIRNGAMADLLSTFSGIFSAENAQKGFSLLAGREGERIASDVVTIVDDPLMPFGWSTAAFDREGAATMRKNVVEGGRLMTLLHNRKTARKAGTRTTGNAAGGGAVSPSNFYLAGGERSLEAMLETMGDGLYLTEVTGLHAGANATSGDFSLLSRGFEVRGGKLGRAVEQFTVAGNFYRLLEDILEVGSDMSFEDFDVGSPSVRVKALSVAGE